MLSECILILSRSLLSSLRRFLSLADMPDLLFFPPRRAGPVDPLRLLFFLFCPARLVLLPPLLLMPLSLCESEPLTSPPCSVSPANKQQTPIVKVGLAQWAQSSQLLAVYIGRFVNWGKQAEEISLLEAMEIAALCSVCR